MSVIERTREIGVLRALGSSRWQVRRTMLDESLLITSAGALVGIVVGLAIGIAWLPGFARVMPGLTFHFPGVDDLRGRRSPRSCSARSRQSSRLGAQRA